MTWSFVPLNIDKDGGMFVVGFVRNLYPITVTAVMALAGF